MGIDVYKLSMANGYNVVLWFKGCVCYFFAKGEHL